jgi:hypothetical protein
MLFLDVPFSQKDEAKALGARWNAEKKRWYVPDGINQTPFGRWLTSPVPSVEAMVAPFEKTGALFVDLVPISAWFSNLRSELTKDEWELVKKATFEPAKYRCQVCGGKGPKHPVECHERWHYDSATKVQKLMGTISFCPSCHEVTHFGLARVWGRDGEALQHLVRTNGWTESFAWQHVLSAMETWKQRSEIEWLLDARWLLDFVPLTEGTKTKILNHAAGLPERKVMEWQDHVIADQAGECGVRRSAD